MLKFGLQLLFIGLPALTIIYFTVKAWRKVDESNLPKKAKRKTRKKKK